MFNKKQSPDPRADVPVRPAELSDEELAAEERAIKTTDLDELAGSSGRMGATGGKMGSSGGENEGY